MVVSGDVVVSVTSVEVTVVLDGPVTVVAAIEAKMLVIIEFNLAIFNTTL